MAKKYVWILLLWFANNAMAQSGQWTWMHGPDSAGNDGKYGVLGIPADSNLPPARYQAAYWRDKQGNFWMFGGVTWQSGPYVEQNDMWKYSTTTNQWTWMSGPQFNGDVNGEYGLKGIPSTLNYPSVRGWGVNCWTDTTGMLWLYGGYGSDSAGARGDLSDLWKFNPYTLEWTWINGASTIYNRTKYGAIGMYTDSTQPGSLQEVKSSWVSLIDNTFYTFGGKHFNYGAYNFETSNDMWQYDATINQWRWLKGDTANTKFGNYGVRGLEASTNMPPGRASYTKWQDATGNFYIFGGARFYDTANLNDTWRYNPLTNNWTWVNGSSIKNTQEPIPNYCMPDTNASPRPRLENQTAQSLRCSNQFWNFGGFDLLKTKNYNDLWLYNSEKNKWTRVFGKDTMNFTGVYGTKGVPSPNTEISARCGVCIWTDANNDVWIFGGINEKINNVHNSMFRFTPDTSCFNSTLFVGIKLPLPQDSIICSGDTTYIYNLDSNWVTGIQPSNSVAYNSNNKSIALFPTTTTIYNFYGYEINALQCGKTDSLNFKITVLPNKVPNLNNATLSACKNDTVSIILDTAINYNWTPIINTYTNADSSNLNIKVNYNTTYTIIGSSVGACSGKDTAVINTNVITLNSINIPWQNSNTICLGDSVLLLLSNPAYVINNVVPNTNWFTNADTSKIWLAPTTSTLYSFIIEDKSSTCPNLDTVEVVVAVQQSVPPILPYIPSTTYCKGDTLIINLPLNNTYSFSPKTNVYANNGQYLIITNSSTTYTITATEISACAATTATSFSITILPNAVADFEFTNIPYYYPSGTVTANNKSIGATNYNWFIGNYSYINSLYNLNYTVQDTGNYCFTLVAKNSNNCNDTITKCQPVINDTNSFLVVPTVFSPNGDNVNDGLAIIYRNVTLVEFVIYNRWGSLVYSSTDINTKWNGVYNGKDADMDTYVYYLKYKNHKGESILLKGDITLIR